MIHGVSIRTWGDGKHPSLLVQARGRGMEKLPPSDAVVKSPGDISSPFAIFEPFAVAGTQVP